VPLKTVTKCRCGFDDAVTWRESGWDYIRCRQCNLLGSYRVDETKPPAVESETTRLRDALRALHDIVLMREAGATDLLPDLARAMVRARDVLGG
jgi:hypothetical protein